MSLIQVLTHQTGIEADRSRHMRSEQRRSELRLVGDEAAVLGHHPHRPRLDPTTQSQKICRRGQALRELCCLESVAMLVARPAARHEICICNLPLTGSLLVSSAIAREVLSTGSPASFLGP